MSASNLSDSVVVEIRAAEGGADAKLLVLEQVKIYLRLCARRFL
jgi:protein subunit release factor A